MDTTATTPNQPEQLTPSSKRLIAAASIGNALEWFDLVVYGFFAATISRLFFPNEDETVSLLITLGTFGVSFFMRPLGAFVLGVYADRVGRRATLTLAISLMMLGTFMIAVMPTYQTIGIWAPIGIVAARMIQGFSAGGEFGSATAFLAEHSKNRRGFFASWQVASQGITTLLAAGFGAGLNAWLTTEQLESWGWRVPFFFGLIIGPVAYYIRTKIDETPEFLSAKRTETPLADTFTLNRMSLVLAIGAVVLGTVATYLVLYMPTYAVKQLGIPASAAFAATLVTGLVQFIVSPMVGNWSDKHGRTGIMLTAATLFLILIYPMFVLLKASPSFATMMVVQFVLGVLLAGYFGALPALLTDLFPTQSRTTGMSISYSIAVTIFGGFAPFIIAGFISMTGNVLAPSFYVMIAAVISLVSLIAIRKNLNLR
jgi:MHS family proline/betaine transporter-like MFS transporter